MHRNPSVAEKQTLYVVATPLGNLADLTLRAVDILGSVDWVAAEDTRVSANLLHHYGWGPKLLSLHAHNERSASLRVLDLLAQGASVALISDAGTPGISDPGSFLVDSARNAGYAVVPIPGASAVAAAISVAGFSQGPFLFYGFLPARGSARRTALAALGNSPWTLVFYEAPHRVVAAVQDMVSSLGPDRRIMIARELTKIHENIYVCPLSDAMEWLHSDLNHRRGEFVLVLEATLTPDPVAGLDSTHVLQTLLGELPVKQAVSLAVRITGAPRNALYQQALEIKHQP